MAGVPKLPRTTAYLPGGRQGTCPVCGAPAVQSSRYPRALCAPCTKSAVCAPHGLPAELGDAGTASFAGGWLPGHVEADGSWRPCGEEVLVAGRPCRLREARFGGTVVEPG